MQDLFFELIRVAIGTQVSLSRQPMADEWNELFPMARKQSLVGICFLALQKLGADADEGYIRIGMSKDTYFRWVGLAAKICVQNELQSELLPRVSRFLKEKGHRTIFMKGQVCGSRYPDPQFRQCGDIDFVVKREEFVDVMKALEEIARVDYGLVHEHHGMAHIDGVTLEPHYKIHNFQNPWNDRTMARYQQVMLERKERRTMAFGAKCMEAEVFPMEFEGMHLVSHMVNHVYEEGLGLRQVMDFAFWLKVVKNGAEKVENGAEGFDKSLYQHYLERMHMTRAARVFTCICERTMGIDPGIMGYDYTEKDLAFADRMLEDIMAVGNFARGAEENHSAGWNSYKWVLKRSVRLAYLCPSEAWWWPACKFTRYIRKSIKSIIKR